MKLEMITSKGLAHNSYFLSDGEQALVVDPRRDCIVYTELAEQECSKIKYILETHRNEDYVIGSTELQNLTDAEIAHSKRLPFKYGEHSLDDGDTFALGNLRIAALYTPGHTDDSMCYVVYYAHERAEPILLFAGDTLFAGGVGRTDLYGLNVQRTQTEKLYRSLHEKVLPLGDHVLVYPAHGAGSVCGHHISDRPLSTIGYERKTNLMLSLDKEDFINQSISQKMLVPPYFRRMEEYNLNGASSLREIPTPKPLTVSEFEAEMRKPDATVVDTRMPGAFAGSFIPGSLNVWLDGLSIFPGWILDHKQQILLVLEHEQDFETAKSYLWRIGFENIVGYLCPGIAEWRNTGKPIERLNTLSATELKESLDQDGLFVVDVREPSEWAEGYIDGAEGIYVGHLKQRADRLPRDKPIAVYCSVGNRGGLAASILKGLGFRDVYNVLGGIIAWENLGYPLKRENEE